MIGSRPSRICVDGLIVAIDDKISAYLNLDSCFASYDDTPAASHAVFYPAAVHDHRRSANVIFGITRLGGKILCVEANDRNAKCLPPSTLAFDGHNRHGEAIGKKSVLAHGT